MPAVLDFPVGPSIGDRFPMPSVAGQPQYIWDGEKWTTESPGVTAAPPASALPLEDSATAAVGVTTRYAREDHVHPSTALKYSAQTLTSAQQVQSRQNLYAAPLDSLAYSGMQINGAMEVSQERGNTQYTGTNTSAYLHDGMAFRNVSAGTLVVMAYPNYTTGGSYPPGFRASALAQSTTPIASLAAGDLTYMQAKIEGYRFSRMAWGTANAQTITIGFWIFTTAVGTVTVSVCNSDGTRLYLTPVTINAASTWEYKTVTIPGDTSGTWDKTTGIGLAVMFCFGAGANFSGGTAGVWSSAGKFGVAAQTNFFAATSNIVQITGVVVLPGIEAPSAERSPLIMRPYDQELLTCYRYYYRRAVSGWMATIQAYSANNASGPILEFPVTMRAAPTATVTNSAASVMTNAAGAQFAITTGTYPTTPDMMLGAALGAAGLTLRAGDAVLIGTSGAGVFYNLDARL